MTTEVVDTRPPGRALVAGPLWGEVAQVFGHLPSHGGLDYLGDYFYRIAGGVPHRGVTQPPLAQHFWGGAEAPWEDIFPTRAVSGRTATWQAWWGSWWTWRGDLRWEAPGDEVPEVVVRDELRGGAEGVVRDVF